MVRFDWTQASISATPGAVRAVFAAAWPGSEWEPLKTSRQGYAIAERLVDVDGQIAQLLHGGMHEKPHLVLTGETTPKCVEVLRSEFPQHTVSRADVCVDYGEPGDYDRLQDIALGVARERSIKVRTAGDHLLTFEGRTLYLGSPTSHTQLRLYDKAAELRHKVRHDPVRLLAVPAQLARLEIQVRPATPAAKRLAATAEPLSLMGSTAWSRALMQRVADVDLKPFPAGRVWRQADDERAYAGCLAMYGPLLIRRAEELGGFDCLGLQIGHDLAQRDAAKRRFS